PAVFFSGDGSLGYSLADLETVARYNLKNISLIIANDSAWGASKSTQLRLFKRTMSVDFLPVNYAKVAESMGCRGIRVEEPEEIEDALKIAFNREKPTLVDVAVADVKDDTEYENIYSGFFDARSNI
ncbi:MAG TPA: thiamine pyrophosphate-dependent enzyme, partial [Candidatus Bathyarchaeia archaeon]|nr:thiamine pyrophosphate-dependent enzyme [Candidatus Bathyarchaeia archaeon]